MLVMEVGEEIYEILSALDKNGRLPVRYEGSYHVILINLKSY